MHLVSRGEGVFLEDSGFLVFWFWLSGSGFLAFWFWLSGFLVLVFTSSNSGFYFRMCWRFSSQKHPENKSWVGPAISLPLDDLKIRQRCHARGLILEAYHQHSYRGYFFGARGY